MLYCQYFIIKESVLNSNFVLSSESQSSSRVSEKQSTPVKGPVPNFQKVTRIEKHLMKAGGTTSKLCDNNNQDKDNSY